MSWFKKDPELTMKDFPMISALDKQNEQLKLVQQLNQRQPLPTGMTEFEEWSDRIISGALLSADVDSQKFALADMILHLGPTESHKEDAFFIHSLRKVAVNQICVAKRQEIQERAKARLATEEAAEKEAAEKAELGLKSGTLVTTAT